MSTTRWNPTGETAWRAMRSIVSQAREPFLRGGIKRAMDAIAGLILVTFGARLATE